MEVIHPIVTASRTLENAANNLKNVYELAKLTWRLSSHSHGTLLEAISAVLQPYVTQKEALQMQPLYFACSILAELLSNEFLTVFSAANTINVLDLIKNISFEAPLCDKERICALSKVWKICLLHQLRSRLWDDEFSMLIPITALLRFLERLVTQTGGVEATDDIAIPAVEAVETLLLYCTNLSEPRDDAKKAFKTICRQGLRPFVENGERNFVQSKPEIYAALQCSAITMATQDSSAPTEKLRNLFTEVIVEDLGHDNTWATACARKALDEILIEAIT